MTSHRCWFSSFYTGLVLLFSSLQGHSHPAVGVVRDQQGSIFYSDLTQVWRLSTTGSKEVVVPKVHTHELCLDVDGNLFGEHLWYEGDATKKWRHYVWRRPQNGKPETIIPSTEGFLPNYSFVRDLAGNMYWIDREA